MRNLGRSATLIIGCLSILSIALAYSDTVYRVKRNDTLIAISRKFGVTHEELAQHNNLKNSDSIREGQRLRIPEDSAPEYRTYTIRYGDTLADIAQRYRTTIEQLQRDNNITNPDLVHTGQVLRIPISGSGSSASSSSSKLSSSIRYQIEKPRVQPHRWKYIIIHHSATSSGNPKGMDYFHRRVRHMENGLAYHFVIGNGNSMNDGEIFVGNRWDNQIDGGHLASARQNAECIGICLVGHFDQNRPTSKQLDALKNLVEYLARDLGIPTQNIQTHQQINTISTKCPGKYFPYKQFISSLNL